MSALPNPFDFGFADVVMPSAEKAAASPSAKVDDAAAARFDRLFDPEKFLRDIGLGLPDMGAQGFANMMGEEPLPVFITDPSPDFIAAMHRDVLPIIEDAVRRAG